MWNPHCGCTIVPLTRIQSARVWGKISRIKNKKITKSKYQIEFQTKGHLMAYALGILGILVTATGVANGLWGSS